MDIVLKVEKVEADEADSEFMDAQLAHSDEQNLIDIEKSDVKQERLDIKKEWLAEDSVVDNVKNEDSAPPPDGLLKECRGLVDIINIEGYSGKSLQQKWKNIRTSFSRELKRRSGAKSGAAASRKSSYVYFPQLQFLKETVQNNQTQASIDETEVISNDEGGNFQIRSPVSKKRKKSDDDSLIEVLKESISLRENRERKQECDSDRLFMLSLLDDFRKIPEDRRLSTKMELMDVIKRAQTLRVEINDQSYSHSVPYIHRYGPEASSNIDQYHHEHSVPPNYGPGAFRSKQYHGYNTTGYSAQPNYGPGASSSGQNRSVFATPISENQNTTIVYHEGLSPTDSNVTTKYV